MRSLAWCSLALLLAACGGGAARVPGPFAYDTKAPLAVRIGRAVATSPQATIRAVTYRGLGSTRVAGYLVVPRSRGRHAAVLFLHGSGGSRTDMLVPAAKLALRGAVTLTISEPNGAQTYRPLVVDALRALDLLAARPDVDASRLGVVGFSLGAQTAAIVAGVDRRARAVGIIGGRGSDVARYWIRRTHAHLFFQAGTKDRVVPHAELLALIRAAPDDPRVRWYAVPHGVTPRMEADQLNWQAAQLGLG